MAKAASSAGVRRNAAPRASPAVRSPPAYQADTSRPSAPPRKNRLAANKMAARYSLTTVPPDVASTWVTLSPLPNV